MKVITFREPLHDVPRHVPDLMDDEKLVELWRSSWYRYGWQPVVLNLSWAEIHPLYDYMRTQAAVLPSINDKRFEWLCFARWLAYVMFLFETPGMAAAVDYDVINYGLTPSDTPTSGLHSLGSPLHEKSSHGMGVVADFSGFSRIVGWLKTHEMLTVYDNWEGKLHVSDWTIFKSHLRHFNSCLGHEIYVNDPGWETSKLVHYGGGRVPAPKTQFIENARPVT